MKRAVLWTSAVCLLYIGLAAAPGHAEITQAQINDVGKELGCMCGTCPHRPVSECTCGWAEQARDRIKTMLAAGQSKQAIIAAFVRDYGEQVLSKPPAKGFNLTAWVMPPFILLVGFFVVRGVIKSWSQEKPAEAVASTEPDKTDPYFARLQKELRERDT